MGPNLFPGNMKGPSVRKRPREMLSAVYRIKARIIGPTSLLVPAAPPLGSTTQLFSTIQSTPSVDDVSYLYR